MEQYASLFGFFISVNFTKKLSLNSVKYFFLLLLLFCTPDSPEYISESEARLRLYLLTISKCSASGIDPNSKQLEIFAFVEKQFKTNSLKENQRNKVVYYTKDFLKCERSILILPITKCDFKEIDLINLISKGAVCKLEPASYYNF
jgi:hypothetical protein